MDYGAVYHRTEEPYCYARDKDTLMINLKTGYDVQRVWIHQGDPYLAGIMGGKEKWQGERIELEPPRRLQHHLWWTIKLNPPFKRCQYFFELFSERGSVFFLEDGFYTREEMEKPGKRPAYFIFPWMNEADLCTTPDWVNDTVWYQIFPDRFCNGDPERNGAGAKPWRYEKVGGSDYYGGDIKGIISRLPYLQGLGINGLYLTPVFEAASNHKYNTRDYRRVDPQFGSNEDLRQLVREAHNRGIRVMLDGVFNHTGTDIEMWQDILKYGKESPYADWYMIHQWPVEMGKSTEDGRFYSFAFSDGMPKLNTNHPKVIRYLLDIVGFWIQEFDVDGLRLDVGNEVSHCFLKELRKMTKEMKPDFYLLGEIWHDGISWLRGDEYDAVMNYPLSSGISDFWLYPERGRKEFEFAVNRCFSMYMEQTNRVLFNLLDSHDTNRLIDQVKGDKDIFYQQLAVLFTMPGSPCIYYGTEIAMEGGYDPDCRRCMPWEEIERGAYEAEQQEMEELIRLRKNLPAFRSNLVSFPDRIPESRLIIYQKWEGSQGIEVLLNCGNEPVRVGGQLKLLYERRYELDQLMPKGILIREICLDQDGKGM